MKIIKKIYNIIKPQDGNEAMLYLITVFLALGFAIIGLTNH
jgi:hypothetical protein